jgi:malonyl-CoA O-methyltransferase
MPEMSREANIGLVERFYYELWNRFDQSLIPELLTEDIRFRGSLGQYKVGHEQFQEYMEFIRRAFPDFTNQVDEIVSEGERCFARLTYRGTHRGEVFGMAPTLRPIAYAGAALFYFREGRIADVWVLGDVHGLIQQLTAPPPDTLPEVLPTRAGYNRWAEVYDTEDNPLVLLEEQHINPLLRVAPGQSVADIGCGTGRHALRLAALGARVTAVDYSEAMLQRARAKPGAEAVTFIGHDLTMPLPLDAGSFDRVLCCLVLDHIPNLVGLFQELGRICRPRGFVIVSVVHPAMLLRGVQARFIDPASGCRVRLQSYPHQIADYVMAAVRAGLVLDHLSEHAVDQALADRSERAQKYLDWPLLFLMRLAP